MKLGNKELFIIFVLITVVSTRLFLWFVPENSPIFNDYLHHLYYGVIIVAICILLSKRLGTKLIISSSIGIGLIIDELVFLVPYFYGNGSKSAYFSPVSIIGALLLLALVFLLRGKISRIIFGAEK